MSLTGKMDKHFTVLWDGGHIKFFSVQTLSALLAEEKCTDCQFEFAGRIPYLWKSMLVLATFQNFCNHYWICNEKFFVTNQPKKRELNKKRIAAKQSDERVKKGVTRI